MSRVVVVALALAAASAPAAAQRSVELPARDRPLAGTPATVFTIGRDEGESWEMLANVSGVDFDARDQLFILDAGNHRVLVVDARGRLVRSFGKRGGGPGELLAPASLAVLSDGTVAVGDLGRGAFSIFGPDGSFKYNLPFADTLGMPIPEQRGSGPGVLAHPAGLAVLGALRMSAGPRDGPVAPADAVPLYLRPLAEQSTARLLYRIPREPPIMRASGSENRRSVRSVPRAFTPQPGWATLPDGRFVVLHGNSPEYRVHVLSAEGQLQRTLSRPLTPRRVTRADQQAAREQMAERMRSGVGMIRMEVRASGGNVKRSVSTGGGGSGPSEQEIQEQLREMEFAEVVPAVSGVRADPQGRIWVARAPARPGRDAAVDLLTPEGRYLGTTAPQPLPDAFSRSGLAAYITIDPELGIEQVVVKKLPDWRQQ